MKSGNLKRLAAFPGTASIVLAGMLVLGSGPGAKAEDGSLVGLWRVEVTVRNCTTMDEVRAFPALFNFATGGTFTETTAGQFPALATPGLGVWQQKGDRTYSAVFEAFVFSPAGVWIQTHRISRVIELSDNADEFTDTVHLEILDPNGNLVARGCATSLAHRFE